VDPSAYDTMALVELVRTTSPVGGVVAGTQGSESRLRMWAAVVAPDAAVVNALGDDGQVQTITRGVGPEMLLAAAVGAGFSSEAAVLRLTARNQLTRSGLRGRRGGVAGPAGARRGGRDHRRVGGAPARRRDRALPRPHRGGGRAVRRHDERRVGGFVVRVDAQGRDRWRAIPLDARDARVVDAAWTEDGALVVVGASGSAPSPRWWLYREPPQAR
jgi:hypothetical protein